MGYGLNLVARHLPVRHTIFYSWLRGPERRDRVIKHSLLSAPITPSNLERVRATISRLNRPDLIFEIGWAWLLLAICNCLLPRSACWEYRAGSATLSMDSFNQAWPARSRPRSRASRFWQAG